MDNTHAPSGSYGWCLIPPTVLARPDLSLREKFLMGRILGLITTTGYCYASNAWLGNQLGISKHTVTHLLTSLVRKGLLTVELMKDHNGQITERRIYPLIQPEEHPRSSLEGVSPKMARGVSPISTIPLAESDERGIVEIGEESIRDKRVEKSVEKKKAGETRSPATIGRCPSSVHSLTTPPSCGHDAPHSSDPSPDSRDTPVVPHSRPPYLPQNVPLDHPVCQVLSRFADHWAAISRQTLDVAIARAVKEIHSRLRTTPLPDLLHLVDLWFNPGLSWVTKAARGAFHTFIQPRAISELKGLKAGLPTTRSSQRPDGHLKPRPHAEWKNVPPGETVL